MSAAPHGLPRASASAFALALLTFLVFRGVLDHEFVNYDDPDYVTENQTVQAGLTAAGLEWAFTTGHAGNWHPLTWLSHQADAQMFGLKSFGHHLTNLLLHCANAGLVYLLIFWMTGANWRSAFVAALFALHPLRVESVAWVAERKDVLCGFWFLLSLLSYARYVTCDRWRVTGNDNHAPRITRSAEPSPLRPSPSPAGAGESPRPSDGRGWHEVTGEGRQRPGEGCGEKAHSGGQEQGEVSSFSSSSLQPVSSPWYWLALLCFALALMSKPMAVTLPFVLLLLDLWPLKRISAFSFQRSTFPRSLLLEKLPFFALTLASCVVTFVVQQRGGAMTSTAAFGDRLANAVVAYGRYLAKSVWPENLAVFYPYPSSWPAEWLIGSAILLVAISWFACRWLRSRPAFAVGWFWFIGMLVPTIGLVQVGGQSIADRYTYLPQIGLFLAVSFACPPFGELPAWSRPTILPVSLLILGAFAWQSARQVAHWHDSESLFRHALAVTVRNEVAHNNLGVALQKRGDWAAAAEQHAAAIQIKSRYADAQMNLGNCLMRLGDPTNALAHLQQALELAPSAKGHYNLGTAYFELGRREEAREQLQHAVALDPSLAVAHLNLGIVELALGNPAAAEAACRAALALRADWPEAWLQLGNALGAKKDFAAAVEAFAQSARLNERDTTALFNLASAYVELSKLREASVTLDQLLVINPADLEARRLLADVRLRGGDAAGAVSQLEQLVRLAPGPASQLALAQGLLAAGRRTEAIGTYREVLRLQPELPGALNDLAWLLATDPDAGARKGAEAVTYAEKACALTQRKNPLLLGTLAAAYAEAGQFTNAVQAAEEAIALAKAAGITPIVERNEELLKLYRAGKPFHEQ